MQNTFNNYEPAGPLSYLLMDEDGNMQLGLYKKIGLNKLVLILKFKTEYFVINPPEEMMNAFFRNEKTVIDMAYHPENIYLTDTENNPLSKDQAWEIYNYILSQLSGTLSTQLFFTTYPNYYYLYRERMEIFNN
jgi:hypothetical protein